MFADDAESIIKSTKTSTQQSYDDSTGDLILSFGKDKIDISGFNEEDYKKLANELSHEFAAKEIIDTIKSYPDLSDLNKRLSNEEISVDTDRVYASISNSDGELVFSIESKNNDSSTALTEKDGFHYIAWSSTTNEGVYYQSLNDGLKSTQSYIISLEPETNENVKKIKFKA